jgi:transposase
VKEVSVAAPKKYPDELRERAVRLCRESDPKPVIRRLAEQLGVHHEALRNWIRRAEADHGERHGRSTTAETEELRRLRKENAELRRANEILTAASGSPSNVTRHRGGVPTPSCSNTSARSTTAPVPRTALRGCTPPCAVAAGTSRASGSRG